MAPRRGAGIIHLTKTLAFEWARHGILVNAIAPGTIETEGLDQYNPADIDAAIRRLPIKRFGPAARGRADGRVPGLAGR